MDISFILVTASVTIGAFAFWIGLFMFRVFRNKRLRVRRYINNSKEAVAVIVRCKENYADVDGERTLISVDPVVEYFDEFKGQVVQRVVKFPILSNLQDGRLPTEPIQIRYNLKDIKICDRRYVEEKYFNGTPELTIFAVCLAIVIICVIVLIIGIVLPDMDVIMSMLE